MAVAVIQFVPREQPATDSGGHDGLDRGMLRCPVLWLFGGVAQVTNLSFAIGFVGIIASLIAPAALTAASTASAELPGRGGGRQRRPTVSSRPPTSSRPRKEKPRDIHLITWTGGIM